MDSKLFIYIVMLNFAASYLCAQNYVLTKSTFSNSGASASSASYILKDATAQSIIGQSESSNRIEQAGFYTYSTLKVGAEETEDQLMPKVLGLQFWPNPASRTTTIRYSVPKVSPVSIKVYDITGRMVKVLVEGYRKPGFYTLSWDGKSEQGATMASGIYFLKMRAENFNLTKKFVLMR